MNLHGTGKIFGFLCVITIMYHEDLGYVKEYEKKDTNRSTTK
jgi:hypothetical protein